MGKTMMPETLEEDCFYTSIRADTPGRLIMMPIGDLLTCKISDEANEVADFDHAPVRQNGQIVGIFDRNRKDLVGRVEKNFRMLRARLPPAQDRAIRYRPPAHVL
jgi:hypothetical protein